MPPPPGEARRCRGGCSVLAEDRGAHSGGSVSVLRRRNSVTGATAGDPNSSRTAPGRTRVDRETRKCEDSGLRKLRTGGISRRTLQDEEGGPRFHHLPPGEARICGASETED